MDKGGRQSVLGVGEGKGQRKRRSPRAGSPRGARAGLPRAHDEEILQVAKCHDHQEPAQTDHQEPAQTLAPEMGQEGAAGGTDTPLHDTTNDDDVDLGSVEALWV